LITSAQNSKLKLVRALLTQPKARREEHRMVLEGMRLIGDVIQQGYTPDFVLYHPHAPYTDFLAELQAKHLDVMPVEPHLFSGLTDTENTQGIIAVFPQPELSLPPDASLLLALDGLRDPGNLGTILRTAAAAEVDGVLLLPGTVDAYNPKVVRSGMGAHFRLPILPLDWEAFEEQFGSRWVVWCADARAPAAKPYTANLWGHPSILIIGGEAHGLSDEAQQYALNSVTIPLAAGVESLNSAVAAAVILFEIRRQRNL
jgi:TrmH family RNA methyltransferase